MLNKIRNIYLKVCVVLFRLESMSRFVHVTHINNSFLEKLFMFVIKVDFDVCNLSIGSHESVSGYGGMLPRKKIEYYAIWCILKCILVKF